MLSEAVETKETVSAVGYCIDITDPGGQILLLNFTVKPVIPSVL